MFAFAIYDENQKKIFMARDRYGIKPLYYALLNGEFIFASEQKAIIQHPEFKREINAKILKEYFTFQNILSDEVLLKGIKIVPAGTFITFNVDCMERVAPVLYWDYCFEEPGRQLREEDYIEQLQFLFRQSVKRQLMSDVQVDRKSVV